MSIDWEKELGNQIVLQAVTDYRKSLRGIRVADRMSVEAMMKECEEFFVSDWFKMLTKLDGNLLLTQLQEEYRNERIANSSNAKAHKYYL